MSANEGQGDLRWGVVIGEQERRGRAHGQHTFVLFRADKFLFAWIKNTVNFVEEKCQNYHVLGIFFKSFYYLRKTGFWALWHPSVVFFLWSLFTACWFLHSSTFWMLFDVQTARSAAQHLQLMLHNFISFWQTCLKQKPYCSYQAHHAGDLWEHSLAAFFWQGQALRRLRLRTCCLCYVCVGHLILLLDVQDVPEPPARFFTFNYGSNRVFKELWSGFFFFVSFRVKCLVFKTDKINQLLTEKWMWSFVKRIPLGAKIIKM